MSFFSRFFLQILLLTFFPDLFFPDSFMNFFSPDLFSFQLQSALGKRQTGAVRLNLKVHHSVYVQISFPLFLYLAH